MNRAFLALPFVLAACGGSAHRAGPPPAFTVHSYGTGATRAWVFAPSARPKLIVLFVHGLGGQRETTPFYHRPWLEHMAREGFEVVYPAYEAYPQQNGAMKHLVQGLATAAPHLVRHVPVAARIFSVFPAGTMDQPLNLAPLAGRTKVLILAGDSDQTVANIGANELVTQLAIAGFPYKDVKFEVVRSHGFFVADHLSVLSDSAGARQAFWERADRFFAPLVQQRP
jgi:hypothetical protein